MVTRVAAFGELDTTRISVGQLPILGSTIVCRRFFIFSRSGHCSCRHFWHLPTKIMYMFKSRFFNNPLTALVIWNSKQRESVLANERRVACAWGIIILIRSGLKKTPYFKWIKNWFSTKFLGYSPQKVACHTFAIYACHNTISCNLCEM